MTSGANRSTAPGLAAAGVTVHASAEAWAHGRTGRPPVRPAPPARGVRGRVRRWVGRLALSAPGRRVLKVALKDGAVATMVVHHLSERLSRERDFDDALAEARVERLEHLEDCDWLFSSNQLNLGMARIELGEAAHLFRLLRSMDAPRVAEIGRYRGGTTLLLAAAGARVLTVDVDLLRQAEDAPALARALTRFGLRDRVEIVVADSRAFPVPGDPLDVVFIDGDHSYEGVMADFEHWWPALRAGGHLLLHDADRRYAWVEGVARAADEIRRRPDVRREVPAAGSLAHLVKA